MSDLTRTVLIVEDCSTDALIVKHALRKEFSVEHVRSCAEARARLEQGSHAAVVLDYHIADGTGLDLLRWMSERSVALPVVMISGQGDERIAAEALKLGAYDYIVKSEDTLAALPVDLQRALHRHELEQHAQMLQQIVQNATDTIFTLGLDGRILTVNPAVEAMFGYRPDEVIGRGVDLFFPKETSGQETSRMLASGAAGHGWQGELNGQRKNGSTLLVNLSASVLRDQRGNISCLIGIARDMTERRELLDRLKHLSITDNLTGLFNHRFFHDRLRYEFIRARRYGHGLGCIMLDADYFKSVNDSYGHLVGDEVLKALAGLIAGAVRSVDIVARYGGEEFAVLLPSTHIEGAVRCAQHIWETINTTEIPTRQGALHVTMSLGVTALTPDVANEEELHRRADAALLTAKRRGRNNVCVWDEKVVSSTVEISDVTGHNLADICNNIRRLILPARERYMDMVRPVLDALCRRHPQLRRHSSNVTIFAMELARLAPLKPEEEEALQYAAMFHDVGHITTPPEILNRPGPLTPEERVAVQNHVNVSGTLMGELSLSELEILYVRHHHERYDGQGYPNRLIGEAIPLGARILAIADAYDAMTSPRPHRTQFTDEQALQELERCAGTQFDPVLVRLFLEARHPCAAAS